ncbi:hypothetical protein ACFQH6_17480 [Halobacteriaceae archaeon GCM10025711]
MSRDLQLALALDHRAPETWTWWTYAFVHDHSVPGDAHLWGNLQMYALTAIPAWALYVLEGQHRRFWLVVAFFLTVVPVVIGATTHVVYPELGASLKYGRGFSGVVGAFGGFLLGSTVSAIGARQPERVAYFSLSTLLLLLFASVLVIIGTAPVLFGALTVVTFVGTAWGTRAGHVGTADEYLEWARENRRLAVVIAVGVFVGVLSIVSAFPSDLTRGATLVNVVGHGTGLLVGLFTGMLANGFAS